MNLNDLIEAFVSSAGVNHEEAEESVHRYEIGEPP
jgi:hypothetical protein